MKEKETEPIVFRRGRRVILRPLAHNDIPLLVRWLNDPEVTKFINVYFPMSEVDERRWLETVNDKKQEDITIGVALFDGTLIGTMGIHGIDPKDRRATTGATIGNKEYWGRGYGTEAKMLLLDFVFNTLNLRKVDSSVIAFNERSYRYLLKQGYVEIGRFREHYFVDGKYHDLILMELFRDDFEPIFEAYQKKHLS